MEASQSRKLIGFSPIPSEQNLIFLDFLPDQSFIYFDKRIVTLPTVFTIVI
jgi:hypothetical protein